MTESLPVSSSPESEPVVIDPQNIPGQMKVREIFEQATFSLDDLKQLMDHMGIAESVISPVLMAWEWSFSTLPKQGIMAEALGKVLAFLYEFRVELRSIREKKQPLKIFFAFYKKQESGRMKNPTAVIEQMRQTSEKLAAATADIESPAQPSSGSFRLPTSKDHVSAVDTHHPQDGLTTASLQAYLAAQETQRPLASTDPALLNETKAAHKAAEKAIAEMNAKMAEILPDPPKPQDTTENGVTIQ